MKGSPEISVIVPVYNVEPYLRECVDSILAQSFADFELILVDDGSPDNCGKICDEYAEKDARVQVIHQENGGLSAARNAGIDLAFSNSDSKWLTFIDSDDMVSKEYLKSMLNVAKDNEAEVAVCNLLRFDASATPNEDTEEKRVAMLSGREACFRLYDDDGVVFTIACGKLYLKELFSGIRYPKGVQHEDEATTYRVLYAADRVVELKAQYYYYRVNPSSIMNAHFSLKRFDGLRALKERKVFFEYMGDKELAEKTAIACDSLHAKLMICAKEAGVYNQVPEADKISIRKALRILRKNCTDSNYTYYLVKVHPMWLRPHAYIRKLKKMLHIPCN